LVRRSLFVIGQQEAVGQASRVGSAKRRELNERQRGQLREHHRELNEQRFELRELVEFIVVEQ